MLSPEQALVLGGARRARVQGAVQHAPVRASVSVLPSAA
jgi:hypothetical protein